MYGQISLNLSDLNPKVDVTELKENLQIPGPFIERVELSSENNQRIIVTHTKYSKNLWSRNIQYQRDPSSLTVEVFSPSFFIIICVLFIYLSFINKVY